MLLFVDDDRCLYVCSWLIVVMFVWGCLWCVAGLCCCGCLLVVCWFVVCDVFLACCVLLVGCGLMFVDVFVVAICPFRVLWCSCVLSLLDYC